MFLFDIFLSHHFFQFEKSQEDKEKQDEDCEDTDAKLLKEGYVSFLLLM